MDESKDSSKITENHEKNKFNAKSILDKSIDFIFSSSELKWLIPIFILGVILRFLVSNNIDPLGDEMVHGPHAIGFLHSGLMSSLVHCPVWFYLTDISMNIFGISMFSTRFLSFFFGSLSIILVYLIGSKVFTKRIGIISAFLLSISYFTIRYTLAEMDLAATFFLLAGFYAFILAVEKNKFPYIAAIFVGIASLTKTLALFFVPGFLLAFFIMQKNSNKIWETKEKNEETNSNKNNLIKTYKKPFILAFLFGLIVLFFFSPILIHNYLWYQDKGMVDVYFAQYFDIGNTREAYAGLLGYDKGVTTSFSSFIGMFTSMTKTIFNLDPIIFALAILGIIYLFTSKKHSYLSISLIAFELSGFFFLLLSNNGLITHYVPLIPVLCIFGGFFIENFSQNFKFLDYKKTLIIIIAIILIVQIYWLLPNLTNRCGVCNMKDYIESSMDKNSIVVVDARVYRGRVAWLFSDFHYLESSYLQQLIESNKNLPGEDIPIKVYFVECAVDDCGWGTITAGDLNSSSEELVKAFSASSLPPKIIYGSSKEGESDNNPYFKVYESAMNFKPSSVSLVDSTHEWFYYPVNYEPKEKSFDWYDVDGIFNLFIYKLAWIIVIFSVIAAILSPILVGYYLITNQ